MVREADYGCSVADSDRASWNLACDEKEVQNRTATLEGHFRRQTRRLSGETHRQTRLLIFLPVGFTLVYTSFYCKEIILQWKYTNFLIASIKQLRLLRSSVCS